MTWKSFKSSGRMARTALLTATAPRLPPMTIMTGFSLERPVKASAFWGFPLNNSWRIGVPVSMALLAGSSETVSGKLQHTLVANGMESLFASPGVISDSWIKVGIFRRPAAITTGTVTKPPLEKTTSGFNCFMSFFAS